MSIITPIWAPFGVLISVLITHLISPPLQVRKAVLAAAQEAGAEEVLTSPLDSVRVLGLRVEDLGFRASASKS